MTDIDGESREISAGRGNALAQRPETQAQVFNPLDAEPVAFKRQLQSRQENYDALAMHLRGILIPGKDFGRIHVVNKATCPRPWECSYEQNPRHYSGYQLLASGADKILGVLGLGAAYPGEQDFIRAALKGMQIGDVIMKCLIEGHSKQVIAEGMGACSRDEVNGSLNNCIKRACKRARVDAVLRLPSISALFEADFLAQIARDAAAKRGANSTSSRAQQVNPKFDTGAVLEVMPIGKKLKGVAFAEMDEEALVWILVNFEDKPDIWKGAKRAHEARHATPGATAPEAPPSMHNRATTPSKPARPSTRPPPKAESEPSTEDWFSAYEDYASHQRGR